MYRQIFGQVITAAKFALAVLLATGVTGCWQEVEYTGTVATSPTGASAVTTEDAGANLEQTGEELPLVGQSVPSEMMEPPPAVAAEASGFGNDLADSLAGNDSTLLPQEAVGTGLPWENEATSDPRNESPTPAAADVSTTTDTTPTTIAVEPTLTPSDNTAAADAPPTNPFADAAQPGVENGELQATVEPAISQPGDSGAVTADASTAATEATATEPVASEAAAPAGDIADLQAPSELPATAAAADSVAEIPVPSDAAGRADELNATGAAPDAMAPSSNASNSRLDTWQLGSKLSLTALANDRGLSAEKVQHGMAYCQQLAAGLGTTVAELPEPGLATSSGRPASRQVLNYLLFVQGQQVGRELASRHGADHAALFEVATKSNLLLVLYVPGASSASAISEAISQAAPRAQLPAKMWQPLLNLVAARADAAEVRQAIRSFHADVEAFLARPLATP